MAQAIVQVGANEVTLEIEGSVITTGSGRYADDLVESDAQIDGIYFGNGAKVSPRYANFLVPHIEYFKDLLIEESETY